MTGPAADAARTAEPAETAGAGVAGLPPGERVLICDYGGVLTNPLAETVSAFCRRTGLTPEQLGAALALVAERDGVEPMAQLEVAAISERAFVDRVAEALAEVASLDWDRLPDRSLFGPTWFAGRRPNTAFIEYLRLLRARGERLALLSNNVREWEPLWRATVPADELFDVVVLSCAERVRKPDPRLFEITLERLRVPASACLFVDDVEANCAAARRLGMTAVRFETTGAAVAELERHLVQPRVRVP